MLEGAEPTFSQSGEDRIVHALFSLFSDRRQLGYVDIGAAFAVGHNNTYLAYSQGGSGLLVEADPAYAEQYRQLRPRDTHLSAAVVPQRLRGDGTISFFVMADRGWSTVLPEHIAMAGSLGKGGVERQLTVPTITIDELIERHYGQRELDLVSLDAEGLDAEILAEMDTARFRPKVVIAENTGGVASHRDLMERKGFELYASTFINSIYIDRRSFKL